MGDRQALAPPLREQWRPNRLDSRQLGLQGIAELVGGRHRLRKDHVLPRRFPAATGAGSRQHRNADRTATTKKLRTSPAPVAVSQSVSDLLVVQRKREMLELRGIRTRHMLPVQRKWPDSSGSLVFRSPGRLVDGDMLRVWRDGGWRHLHRVRRLRPMQCVPRYRKRPAVGPPSLPAHGPAQ